MDSPSPLPRGQTKASCELDPAEVLSGALPAWVFASSESDHRLSTPPRPAASHLTVQEVANELRVSQRTVRRLISRGQLQVVRIGRSVRITTAAVEAMLEASVAIIFNSLDHSRD